MSPPRSVFSSLAAQSPYGLAHSSSVNGTVGATGVLTQAQQSSSTSSVLTQAKQSSSSTPYMHPPPCTSITLSRIDPDSDTATIGGDEDEGVNASNNYNVYSQPSQYPYQVMGILSGNTSLQPLLASSSRCVGNSSSSTTGSPGPSSASLLADLMCLL
jgi:hypothetical protein